MLVKLGRFPALPLVLLALALLLTMIPDGSAFGEESVEESSTEAADAAAAGETSADDTAADDTAADDTAADDSEAEPAEEPADAAPVDEPVTDDAAATDAEEEGAPAPTQSSGNGANTGGPYDPNVDGSPSGNGNGNGGGNQPCAGCVGDADDKNPPGQLPGPDDDGDQGYECDGNSGVGKTNPAHSGCPDPAPALHLEKDGPASSKVGDTITYTFVVTNTGNTTLTNVHVTDPLLGTGEIAVSPSTLPAGSSGVIVVGNASADYKVQAADVVDDNVHNVATAHGTPPEGANVTDTDPHDVAIPDVVETPDPAIEVVKSGPDTAIIGETITYTFKVTNVGETALTNVHVTDPLLGTGQFAVSPSTLAVGASGTATAPYTVRAQDVVNDRVPNTATAHGTPPTGPDVTDTDDHIVEVLPKHTICHATGSANNPYEPITISVKAIFDRHLGMQHHDGRDIIPPFTYQNGTHSQNWPEGKAIFENGCVLAPSISLVKDGPATSRVGETITYTFDVTNTGNTTLTNVHITDPLLGTGQIAVTPPTLAPGESGDATADYTVDQADVVDNNVHNEATATGTPPTGPPVTDVDPHDVEITPIPVPAITLLKDGPQSAAVGETITYTFDVTNSGDTPLTNVHITDPLLGTDDIAVTPSELAVGGTGSATATYTVVQADAVNLNVHNVATVHGTSPANEHVIDDDPHDVLILPFGPPPAISLEKGGPEVAEIGDTITYTFDVTNAGETSLVDVYITDPLLGTGRVAVTPSTLPVGGTGTATAQYTVQQADVVNLNVHNLATVFGTSPAGEQVTDDDPHDVRIAKEAPRRPRIHLNKGGPERAEQGDVITYTFEVTNTGKTALTNVRITDPMLSSGTIAVTPSTLPVNGVGTASATYTVTAADARARQIDNVATARGVSPAGVEVEDDDDHTVLVPTPGPGDPGIELEKTGPATARVGDTITYRFRATNTGATTLTNVTITDPMLGGELAVTPSTLAPGESGTASATYEVTRADGRRGSIFNTAIVTGDPPSGPPVEDDDDHTTRIPGPPPPCCDADDPDDPDLPATGADVPSTLLISVLALLLGFGLLRTARSAAPAGPATWSIQAPRLTGSQSPPPVHTRRPSSWSTPRMG